MTAEGGAMVRTRKGAGSSRDLVLGVLGRAAATLALAGIAWAASSSSASALSVAVPGDTGRSFTATVTISPTDPGGTLELRVDGSIVATRAVSPDTQALFTALPVVPGQHTVAAIVRADVGTDVMTSDSVLKSWGAPLQPALVSPSGPAVSNVTNVIVLTGAWNTKVSIAINGVPAGTSAATPGTYVTFGLRSNTAAYTVYAITVSNPIGETGTYYYGFRRIDTPYPTMIVIEKSQYQLHWIVDYQMVKTYPIAHGKGNNTPVRTWMINAKYVTDASGVYGPRKMRLYSYQGGRSGRRGRRGRPGRWTFTAYGIHGTNQPWVIGTMASHGCIRMYNWDVLELWPQVPLGTMAETRR